MFRRKTEDMSPDPRLELAYAEAARALTEQSSSLIAIRARGGLIVASASVSFTVLGGEAAKDPNWSCLFVFAVVSFVGCVALATVSFVNFDFKFALSARVIHGWRDEYSVNEALEWAAVYMDENHDTNNSKIRWISRGLTGASVLLIVQILALLFNLVLGH